MNARLLPEVLVRREATPQVEMPLEAEGVLRYVWASRYGDILVEVRNGQVFVNGQQVEPAQAGEALP